MLQGRGSPRPERPGSPPVCWFYPIPGPLPSGLPEGVKLHLPTSKAARSSAPSPHPGQWYFILPSWLDGCQGREGDGMGVTALPPSIWDASLECEPQPFASPGLEAWGGLGAREELTECQGDG